MASVVQPFFSVLRGFKAGSIDAEFGAVLLTVCFALCACGGCIFMSDFEVLDAPDVQPSDRCAAAEHLCVELTGFSSHVAEYSEFSLVSEDGFLRARAILDPFGTDGSADARFFLPDAIAGIDLPNGQGSSLHWELFCDHDRSQDRVLTPPINREATDHTWRLDLEPNAYVKFAHIGMFSDLTNRPIGAGGDFSLRLNGMVPHVDQLIEVWVSEGSKPGGRTVGFYRLQSLPKPDGQIILIPGIIDTGGTSYRVEIYADHDGSKTHGPITNSGKHDHQWVVTSESGPDGLSIEFDHSTQFEDLTIPPRLGRGF
jgi:hypothetical protein